jgi:hypothetical protein
MENREKLKIGDIVKLQKPYPMYHGNHFGFVKKNNDELYYVDFLTEDIEKIEDVKDIVQKKLGNIFDSFKNS